MIDLDKDIELYKSKVAFYESQNTRGEYDVTVRELKYVVEILEALRSERSQGDLISREALKEKLQARHDNGEEDFDKGYNIGIEAAIELIDNAQAIPQVTVFTESTDEKAVADLKAELQNVIEEKPQGEWEDYSVDFYKCPECGYLLNKDCPCCHNKVILPKGGAE